MDQFPFFLFFKPRFATIRRVTREEVERDKRMTLIRIFLFLVLFVIVVLIIFTSGDVRSFLNLYVT